MMDPNEMSKVSSPSDDNKENFSISEDERDFVDGMGFLSGQKFTVCRARSTSSTIRSMEKRRSDIQAEVSPPSPSPTTAILIRENNQILCPLSRKGPLRQYRGSFAKLTFVSPNAEFEDETTESFATAQTGLHEDEDRGRIICTCCTQCRFCRRLSSFCHRNWADATTQTDPIEMNAIHGRNATSLRSEKSTAAKVASKVVCTYLAEASDEFYPFSKAETLNQIQLSEVQPDSKAPTTTEMPLSSTPVSHEYKQRRLRFKTKQATTKTNTADLFLDYLKLLILRQKEKFTRDFWDIYASAFDHPPCMTTEEVETCRRRFGDGYDTAQLQRMFPSALKSSTSEWRREMQKEAGECYGTPTTPKTPTDQYIRIDRTDRFRSVQSKGSRKMAISSSLRSTPLTSSSPISARQHTGMSTTPSRLRPIKLNRTAILRADAIFSKYWGTP